MHGDVRTIFTDREVMKTEEEKYKDFEVGELVLAKTKVGTGVMLVEGHILRIGRHGGVLCASIKNAKGQVATIKMEDIEKRSDAKNFH